MGRGNQTEDISEKTIGRLSLYRRLLNRLQDAHVESVFSHELAGVAGGTAAQVRRDIMATGYTGSPSRGYQVAELIESIGDFLDAPQPEGVALVGLGNLGRAIMAYFKGRRAKLAIVAAFDVDPNKINRTIHGCRCYAMSDLRQVAQQEGVRLAIIAVPAGQAQAVADELTAAGIRGLLNFAPVPLRTPRDVYVEDIDMTMSLEKVAYFARQARPNRREGK